MGKCMSKVCCQCFSPLEDEAQTSPAKLLEDVSPERNYFEQTYLDACLAPAIDHFLSQLHLPLVSDDMVNELHTNRLHLVSKPVAEGYYLKFETFIPHSPQEFINFLIYSDRMQWDHHIDHIELVSWSDEDTFVTYSRTKKLLFISPRDVLVVTRKINIGGGVLLVTTSVDHENYPVQSGLVRAKVAVAGVYAEKSHAHDNCSRVLGINWADAAGNIPVKLVKKTMCMNYPGILKKQAAALQEFLENQAR